MRGNTISPKRVRIRRLTVTPTASNMRRTSRLRPSCKVTRYQRLLPSPPRYSKEPKAALPSSSSIPSVSDLRCASSISPRTRTAYSRSVP
ncbi:Uncharacterised protein [Bordetella pertussis]|nr:Uncharacterised protein [Bordetella pertussis]CFW20880.1 Uncharacterised protein [Bordetella pertussis]CFW47653.1 Uncharacterised protein [Bordetella pertussis]